MIDWLVKLYYRDTIILLLVTRREGAAAVAEEIVVQSVLIVLPVRVVPVPVTVKAGDNSITHRKVSLTNNNTLETTKTNDFVGTTLDYSPLATAPSANSSNNRPAGQPYAGAYGGDRNSYEMRHKVWQSGDNRVSPPPEYPGTPLTIHFQGPHADNYCAGHERSSSAQVLCDWQHTGTLCKCVWSELKTGAFQWKWRD